MLLKTAPPQEHVPAADVVTVPAEQMAAVAVLHTTTEWQRVLVSTSCRPATARPLQGFTNLPGPAKKKKKKRESTHHRLQSILARFTFRVRTPPW